MAKRSRQPGSNDTATESKGDIGTESSPKASTSCSKASPSRKSFSTLKSPTKTPIKPIRTKILAGIDYGTSHSGAAFVSSINCDARDVQVICDWAGGARKNEQLEKVPSKIAYAWENEDLQEDKWGYEVEPWMKSYTWTKLLLDENAAETEFDNPNLQDAMGKGMLELPINKTAQNVAADYLRCLYDHVMGKLEKTFSKAMMKETPIQFFFTVPASWEDQANDATREAAKAAGFESRIGDELFMITEPEAAAMAILSSSIEKYPGLYKVDSKVLVADLGGGTLDFQCLTIVQLDPLKTEEACPGIGGKSGATYIDFNLHDLLKELFGEEFIKIPSSRKGPGSSFMESFEIVKKTFDGKDLGKTYRLRLPALGRNLLAANIKPANFDFEDGEILLTGAQMQELFEPVVQAALGLVEEQRKQLKRDKASCFKTIALCGGLGTSSYIWARFNEFCKGKMAGEVQLVTDERAWSAVSRGAATRGLEGSMVLSKRARRAYGLGCHHQFQEGIDDEANAFECPLKGKRAEGYVDWFMTKGERYSPNMKKTIRDYIAAGEDDDDNDLIFVWDLYGNYFDATPSRIDDPGVERIGKIKLDLTNRSRKKARVSLSGAEVEEFDINLHLTMGSKRGMLEVTAYHNRAVVGKSKIEYGKDKVRKGSRSAGHR